MAVGAVAGLFATMAPLSAAFAATEPTFPSTSDAPIYLVDGNDNVQYPAGTQLPWNAPLNAHISAIPAPEYPDSEELFRLPYVTGAEQFITFIADPGHERTRADWKAYGTLWSLSGKGALLPNVNPASAINGLPGQAALKTAGGTYSLGVAYVKDTGQTVVAAYFTTINVDPTVGTWKFATPTAPKTATATTLSVPSTATVGDNVTLTATVAPAAATGEVTFKEGSATLGTGTLSDGTATFSTTALAAGSHDIVASYAGDTGYDGSESTASTVTVNKIDTSVSLGADAASVEAGSDVVLTATVNPSNATGNVQFFEGATSLGTGSIAGGTASKTVTVNSVGAHSYTAKVVANATFSESALSAAVTVTGTAAEVALPPKAPSENALLDSNRNGASASIDASNQATLSGLDSSLNGTTVNVFAYSTPTFLGTVVVNGGAVTVDASGLAAGNHKLAIADPNTINVLAWAPFSKTTAAVVPTITKAINAEVEAQEPSDGEFSLVDTSGSSTVTLTNPTFVDGQSLSSGSLGSFKVTDLRQVSKPGWDLNTSVLDFTKGTDVIDKSALGIDPKLISQAGTGATAPTLSAKQDAGSASYPWTFATLANGFSGVTNYNADLTFLAPAGKPAGTYNSTLTLTLVSK
ncbi:MAG: Ig-like domain repeat protein [Propionibacteriaceae bacterium]|nr:Ig-like domain repeat protein [Propionibacteriaceae bacterium]